MAKKILVIDDDRGNVKLIQSALEKNGFETFAAGNGQEGLDMLPKVNPDLIILDVEMPVMNGYTFMGAKNDNPKFQSIPVIVLTAHPEKQPIFQLKNVRSYLIKPLNVEQLLDKINHFVAEKVEVFDANVLVIESNSTQTKLMTHFLSKAGFKNLNFAENGAEGIEKAKSSPPDVIVIRDKLPDLSGYEIAQKLNALDKVKSKMVLLCDSDDDVDKTKFDESKFNSYTLKSAEYDFLIESIKGVIS